MDERDLEPEEPAARCVVDQLGALGPQPGELCADVVDLERDVVHAGAAFREETSDRRVGPERAEQLDPALADAERRRLDALVLDALAVLERAPKSSS